MHSPTDTTLVITWGPPDDPTGNFNYTVSIINLRDGNTVRDEETISTSITQSDLGNSPYDSYIAIITLVLFQLLESPTM